ncbi:hypothetical protein QTI66_01190 [Variovorax sp. J22R133]|uniref:hypothetical protein n=1 Tax=Variovorax brevis TaxID=3053503 RepID=UPI002576BE11|nr:hypothetical protein [Variovorax sp. J22R133]MDM0110739.1 hypothetical protein [Variovorax sp. J22R133]
MDNLADFLSTCVIHPGAANQTFLVSDGADISTTELLRQMAKALGTPARLLPIPSSILGFGAKLLGKADMAQRLCGSLQIDISRTRDLLGWRPPIGVHEGLKKAAGGYLCETRV